MKHPNQIINFLTIDVEEHFQVAAFEDLLPPDSWSNNDSRVVKNTQKILSLLAKYQTKATFFIVGWTAERNPGLVKEISNHGHDIACHSYLHRKIYNLTPDLFYSDTSKAKEIIENIIGKPVLGYRAPSYSITMKSLWALDILKELGFKYDSSIFPIYHDTYGIPNAPRFAYQHENGLLEYPISTALFFNHKIPVSGGGYFRLFPYWFTRFALRRINQKENQPYIFYLHPWELDPKQPRIGQAPLLSRFRHYNQLQYTQKRFERLLKDFSFEPLPRLGT